jgi:NAD(P)-dependent dehydrogenase (short-subunit alcohol dehydrogenase family)
MLVDSPVAVVTGASAGVGRAVAVAFGRRGWRVALIARGLERLESAAREVVDAGGEAVVLPTDVADAQAVSLAADRAAAAWGGIDVWVNNAMATIFAPVEEVTPEEFARVTQVTYLGQVHGTLAALRHMRPRDRGTIVQVGSALAYRSIPLQAAYCAAKAAARAFTDSLRSELLHQRSRIRLTTVHLPAVNTPQFDWARSRLPRALQPVPPIHEPEPVAEAIVGAARDAPRELWIGVATMKAILGTGVAPGWMDALMASRAWEGQMTSREAAAQRAGNLFHPPPGDPGTRGRFSARSRGHVLAPSGTTVRLGLAACGAGLAVGALALAGALARRR